MNIPADLAPRTRPERGARLVDRSHIRNAAQRGALFVLLCVSVTTHAAESSTLLDALSAAFPERMHTPRLSIATGYRRCAAVTWPGETIARSDCGDAALKGDRRRINAVSLGIVRQLRARPDAAALHAEGLVDLLAADSGGISLRRSLSSLDQAARMTGRRAPLLADMAATYLIRSERTQDARDLRHALETAQEAYELEPRNPVALYNRALALDRLALDGEAAEAWEEYLMVDSTSGWAEEARVQGRELARPRRAPAAPDWRAPAAAVEAYVARAPLAARELGWDRLLGAWGAMVLRGDTARAGDRLRLAEALGRALERRGGDATLADAVWAIRSHAGDRRATRALARAHAEYAQAREAYSRTDKIEAGEVCAGILAADPPSPALRAWAAVYRAAGISFGDDRALAVREFRSQTAALDTVRHPALAGMVYSGLATALLRDGKYSDARAASRRAARYFARLHETESVGGELFQQASVEFVMNADVEAHASMHGGLVTLRDNRSSRFLYSLLSFTSYRWAKAGFPRAALALQNEALTVAEASGRDAQIAEGRVWRARLGVSLGDSAGAAEDVATASGIAAGLQEGTRRWIETEMRIVRGRLLLRHDPGQAKVAFDSVASPSDARTELQRLEALVGRAEARLAHADVAGAVDDLALASRLLDEQRDAIEEAPLRASLIDDARGLFDRLVMLEVSRGRTLEALRHLERGRTSFGSGARGTAGERGGWSLPGGSVGVVYALIGDTLLTWTVAGGAARMVRDTVDSDALLASVERTRLLERQETEAAARPELTALYDLLIRPVERRLGGADSPLVVVADGELARVPFAALHDTAADRYLVQTHPLRFALSLHDASRAARPGVPTGEALFVADPAFDRRTHPLERLPGARKEVSAAAAVHPGARVLAGREATRSVVAAALPRAGLFHFAGHAIFDEGRPERSFLVLAPDRAGSSRLTAVDLAAMDLSGVRLVVLSACETLPSREGRSGGFAGFAGALLAAGAGGVVGSLWPVDDWRTRSLMEAFHRAYRRSGDPAAALREAQLELLGEDDPSLFSPAAWAAFRYAGN